IVDEVGIVTGAADHRIGADAAIEHVGTAVTGDHVVERVTGSGVAAVADQGQVLDIGAQRVAGDGHYNVGAFTGILGNRIVYVIAIIRVVAVAAGQRIAASFTIQYIVT